MGVLCLEMKVYNAQSVSIKTEDNLLSLLSFVLLDDCTVHTSGEW